jgi:acetyl-CoA C-acetyltransferase
LTKNRSSSRFYKNDREKVANDLTPIVVGVGQFTQRNAQKGDWKSSKTPMELVIEAARIAAADTGLGDSFLKKADNFSIVQFTADGSEVGRLPVGQYKNPPRTVAQAFGAKPDKEYYTAVGGNTPQWLVNRTAEEIANGETQIALLAGSEDLATMTSALNAGESLDWGDDPGGEPTVIGDNRSGTSQTEKDHALYFPVNVYPLFENAIRGEIGRTVEQHQLEIGKLFSNFSKVASENPYAWFPTFRSPKEIAAPTEKNRYVGFPYTKYMNAIIRIDMAAAVIMTNVKTAREMGIDESKWVYLRGCGDAHDLWNMTDRVNFHSSPAIRTLGRKAFDMAGLTIGEMDFIDLYSCFPSAVEIGAQELGISVDDPRGLTVTGGLPYFGGAGSNYVMHSIATMVEKLRSKPGSSGLTTGNGWYLTKHSIGIYSTLPGDGAWELEAASSYQAELDKISHPHFEETPSGSGTVETYTVVHGREGPRIGIVFGRLENGDRFIAHTSPEQSVLQEMMKVDCLGRPGRVTAGEKTNLFEFG